MNAERDFYETLYTSNQISLENIENVLKELDINSIDNDSALLCEGPVTEQECLEAIQTSTCDKTPGSDGLPANVYQIFWDDIKDILCKVFNECFL